MAPSIPSAVVVIPAYMPGPPLRAVVNGLLQKGTLPIVVVNDGSAPECADLFSELEAYDRVHVVHHAVNLGKGAALKTAMNYALTHFPGSGVVTADADGQHDPADILRVAERLGENPDALILGVRGFGSSVPLRSRLGNTFTRGLVRLLVGRRISDTQTGLRGIPRNFVPDLLRMTSVGYEFELDMLIACKHQGRQIIEEPIRTIYLDGNQSSHFHPLLDSMRIYVVLFRFTILALLTAAIDNGIFILAYHSSGYIGRSQIAARLAAMVFNYFGARRAVFHARQSHASMLPKYIALVAFNGFLSYALIQLFVQRLGLYVVAGKMLAESLVFIGNFTIQRDFVFTKRGADKKATDWDRYYTSVPVTAKLTRKYTTRVLIDAIKSYVKPADGSAAISILEIGGANSCFVEDLMSSIQTRQYDVVDTNEYGLELLKKRVPPGRAIHAHQESVLSLTYKQKADVVFSVGLVEHFDRADTRKAVLAHFDPLLSGQVAIITFPTPTLLYRVSRQFLEMAGLWKFPDERPLMPDEVLASIRERGEVLYQKTLWPLILTQHLIVARKS
jgi:glycosyltransferase involved in cell wall biosynthesis